MFSGHHVLPWHGVFTLRSNEILQINTLAAVCLLEYARDTRTSFARESARVRVHGPGRYELETLTTTCLISPNKESYRI